MKPSLRRDSFLTIAGFACIVAVFLFALFLPGSKASAKVQKEIRLLETSIKNVPVRVAELESLKGDVVRRKEYLEQRKACLPIDPDVHGVIEQVSDLARNSGLQITRLEPLSAVVHESYQTQPFRLSFSGPFRGIAAFLKGLESRERLFHVEKVLLKQKDAKFTGSIEADMDFVLYVKHAKVPGSSENNGKPAGQTADTSPK